ncbi:MAG TPA: TonB family protein [Stellaceae bacterium]|jgi:protein TonB|nr:TonB family protein [Stellaceae bacterium]
MTVTADAFTHARGREPRDIARWGASLVAVLALHVAGVLYLIAHPIAVEPPGMPPAAVLIDLAPLPAPPPIPAPEPVPPPQIVEPEPPPPPPIPIPETPPPLPPPPKAVILPKPPPPRPPKPPKPRPVIERPPLPVPAAPATPRPVTAPPVAAPLAPPQASAAAIAGARANWQARLVGWLASHKRYPRVAQEQHQEGTPAIQFTMDRSGRVLSSHLASSSGNSLLDEETVALLQRAQPLPAPPPEVPGQSFTFTIPIRFYIPR